MQFMRKPSPKSISLAAIGLVALTLVVYLATSHSNGQSRRKNPIDGERAYKYLQQVCEIGRRVSGTPGMTRQQDMLDKHFSQLGGRVLMQAFEVRHPEDGSPVAMKNMIVEWHPDRKERILICAHYDTRPYPDQDRKRPRGLFIGANDGASGVALLSELAHFMPALDSRYGVDFVLFDGEELIFDQRRDADRYFLGSTHFARSYATNPPAHRYRCGVLMDMIADADLQLYYEKTSMKHARPLVLDIWRTAASLGVTEFKQRSRHEVRDDHLPLNNIAKIPTCDIIDFDYPRPGFRERSYWHTEADTPDKCSADSLAKVGWVLLEWLKQVK